ncbi:hypothetical protein PQR34_45505 [Paraburkholderia sediminicola]|uniref:hypothetical protein n=1 Tax=Paraburkholderia sediminicola TaxID=458836 RepID=UPI0038BC4794
MNKPECMAGIGDLKRMIRQRSRDQAEKKSRWIPFAVIAAVVVSVLLTWAFLNAILTDVFRAGLGRH